MFFMNCAIKTDEKTVTETAFRDGFFYALLLVYYIQFFNIILVQY